MPWQWQAKPGIKHHRPTFNLVPPKISRKKIRRRPDFFVSADFRPAVFIFGGTKFFGGGGGGGGIRRLAGLVLRYGPGVSDVGGIEDANQAIDVKIEITKVIVKVIEPQLSAKILTCNRLLAACAEPACTHRHR